MKLANTAPQIQRNMAIQKGVDPKQEWYDGLNQIEFHLANLAGRAAFGGIHEATSMRPNTEEPGVVNVPVQSRYNAISGIELGIDSRNRLKMALVKDLLALYNRKCVESERKVRTQAKVLARAALHDLSDTGAPVRSPAQPR